MKEKIYTCQICARAIKASNGIIAHHGYTRPNSGWQTASCSGARHLPYEVSCNMLPSTIESIKSYIVCQEAFLKNFIANPPEKLIYKKYSGFGMRTNEDVLRPAEFDPKKDTYLKSIDGTYEREYDNKLREIKQSIKAANLDLIFMQERLTKWVPPQKETGL